MSTDYKGIKIPNEIIIVEKHNGQGYVVLPGSSLDSALSWAKYTDSKWIDGKWTVIAEHDGIVHTYKNGEFTISLYDSADRSSQGGKLSFWNCTIHAPDGKDFIIGINADILFNLMMDSTIINGDIQGKVWLGKEKNNTGVYTDAMEDFKQARIEDKIREKKKTTDYKALEIVETLKDRELYLGEFPCYFEIKGLDNGWGIAEPSIHFYSKPKTVHLYMSLYEWEKEKTGKYSIGWIDIRKNKLSRLTTEESIDYLGSPKEILNERWKLLSLPQKDEYNYYTVNRSNASNIINKMSLGLESIDVNDLVECVKIVSGLCCKKVQICGYNEDKGS